jgi:hypothetical protein
MDTEAVALHLKRRFPTQPIILLSAFADPPERDLWSVDDYVMRSEPMERVMQLARRMASRLKEGCGTTRQPVEFMR